VIQTIFTALIVLQFLVSVLHDWVDIPGWTHGRQVRSALGSNKMLIGTLINGLFPVLAVAYALSYWHRLPPSFVLNYWIIYCAITVTGAITAWWIPYFRGTDEKTKQLYLKMYAGTRQVLPAHGDNPRPNLLHLYFHALGLTNLVLATILRFRIVWTPASTPIALCILCRMPR
jgi:hypothetical protein